MNEPWLAEKPEKAGSQRPNGSSDSFRIALKIQAGNVEAAAGTNRKIGSRCCGVKGRIEEWASTGKGIADAHLSADPQPGKTGSGKQRAYVTPFSDAAF